MKRTQSRFIRLAVLALIVGAIVALVGTHSVAQDPEPPEPGRSGAGAERQLETFEPTEKVPADSAVAFPVDI